MPFVSKLSDTSYNIVVSGSDITKAFPEDFTDIPVDITNTTSGKIIDGTVSVEFDPEAADIIRDKVSRKLNLGMDLGDILAENKFLHALYSSPIPFSGLYGSTSPSLDATDDVPISAQLDSLPTSFTFNLGAVQIGLNDTYRLKFIPDARGFDVYLENVDLEDNLLEDHPFALTLPFEISSIDVNNPVVEDGVPTKSVPGTVDDAKVLFYEKDFPISGGEVLTRAVALSGIRDRGMVIDAYNSLFTLSMWRGGNGVVVEDKALRPFSSHLCGVDPHGKSIQYLPLDGLVGSEQIGSGNLIFTGNTTVKFLVGEIRYPFNPIFGLTKTLFDICTDDEGWTDVGPLADQYIGGTGIEGVGVIHSWTGRKSIVAKKETLSSIGQSKLEG